jgi:Na+-transporting methylmalonyl-CoA/oxaloacetate decarboxylase gamma subunit
MMYAALGLLVIVLGAMSYVVERAGKPEPPKPPTAEQTKAREQAINQRKKEDAASRARMMESIKSAAGDKGAKAPGGKRPVNETAPRPPDPKGGKKNLPVGALDISGDWHKQRKPGDAGITEMEKEAAKNPAPPAPGPKLAPTTPSK